MSPRHASAARGTFLEAYGEVPPELLDRARWRAVSHSVAALAASLERGDPVLARASRAALVEIASEGT